MIKDEQLTNINLALEVATRTTLLGANAANRIAKHSYYPAKNALESAPNSSHTQTNEFWEWAEGLRFELAQITQNSAVQWLIQQHQMRLRLVELGLLDEATPDIPSCSLGPDGTIVIGGSC